jgi:hypothetical protein
MPGVSLANLTLPAHWYALSMLPRPDESELTEMDRDGCLRIARRVQDLWLRVIRFECEYPDAFVAPDWARSRPQDNQSNSDALERLFTVADIQSQAHQILGSYYAFAAFRTLEQTDVPSIIRVGSSLTSYESCELTVVENDDIALSFLSLSTTLATIDVLNTIGCIQLAATVTIASLAPGVSLSLDAQSKLYELLADIAPRSDVLPCTVARHSLRYLARVYQPSEVTTDLPLSASLRTHEFLALASRTEAIQRRYGARMISRLFERQLALVLESLGFLVAPAAAGTRGSDILCISRDDAHSYSMLVEAKTSHRPYALPARDGRALTEYVGQFQRYMGDLPRLAGVLLVGHGPMDTAAPKMRILQDHLGVPFRFVDAGDLVWLRNQFLGPVNRRLWHDALVTSDVIVTRMSLEVLVARHTQTRDSYLHFAEQLRKTQLRAATLKENTAM